MTQILDDPAVRTPTMMYLFHRVEERLDGSPAIIVVDEGWKALDDEVFVRRIKDWEKTIRKRNGIVGFATQSAQDALESKIAQVVSLCRTLRTETAQLRQQLAAAEIDKQSLAERMDSARSRIEQLAEQLPKATV